MLTLVKAQEYNLELGPIFKETKNILPGNIFGHDEGGYYVLQQEEGGYYIGSTTMDASTRKGDFYLKKFDKNLNLKSSILLNLYTDKIKEKVEAALFANEKIFLFSRVNNYNEKIITFIIREVNPLSFHIPKDGKVFSEFSFTGSSYNFQIPLSVHFSADSSYCLMYHPLLNQPGTPVQFRMKMFSREMDLLWEKDYESEFGRGQYKVQEVSVSNGGEVCMLVKKYERIQTQWSWRDDFEYTIVTLNQGMTESKVLALNEPGKKLVHARIAFLPDQQLAVAGTFQENPSTRRTDEIQGFFFQTFDNQKFNTLIRRYSAIDQIPVHTSTRQTGTESEPAISKSIKVSNSYPGFKFKNIIVRSDGNIILIGETEELVVNPGNFGNPSAVGTSSMTTSAIHFKNILLLTLKPNGEIINAAQIHKLQSGFPISSYSVGVHNEKVFLIFNDLAKNAEIEPGKKLQLYSQSFGTTKKHVVVAFTYDGFQLSERKVLINTREAKGFFATGFSHQLASDKMLLMFFTGKKRRLAILTL